MIDQAEAVIHFWLEETDAARRFASDSALDQEIERRFGTLHAQLAQGVPDAWRATPRNLLAAVIVLDQFSRNLHRNDARAYAQDESARALAREAIAKGWDRDQSVLARQFLYMPFMHSESLADQDEAVDLFGSLGEPVSLDFAQRHRDQIAEYGRFPQRNEPLGRQSTAAEIAFLERPGSRF